MKAVSLIAVATALALTTSADAQRPVRAPQVRERLAAPENLRIEQSGDNEVVLSWTPVPGARGYILGRAVGNEGFRRLLDPPEHHGSSYRDAALQNGVRVVYTVTPVDSQGTAGVRAVSQPFDTWRPPGTGGWTRGGTGGGTPGGTPNSGSTPGTPADTTPSSASDSSGTSSTTTGSSGTGGSASSMRPAPGPVEIVVTGTTAFASWPAVAQADTYDIDVREVLSARGGAVLGNRTARKRVAAPEVAFTDMPAGSYNLTVFAENFPDPTRRSKDDRMWRTASSPGQRFRIVPTAPADTTAIGASTRPQVPVRVEHLAPVRLAQGQARDLKLAPAGGQLASLNTSVALVDESTGTVIGRNPGWTTLVWTKLEDAGVWIRIIEVEVTAP